MGRRSINKKPMTPTQYQRRWRANVKRKAALAAYEARREQRRIARGTNEGSAEPVRIGRAQEVLADIADNSAALIFTDPPYADEATPLYHWLGEFAMRTLIPGGSLICFTGGFGVSRYTSAFLAAGLREWRQLTFLHDQSKRDLAMGVYADSKPVLWFVKGKSRRNKQMFSTVLTSTWRNKEAHKWGQGEGGIAPVVERLVRRGELVVDPFAGTGEWGDICASLGCRWIGADIVRGGSRQIEV
jgi:DNA methylase